MLKFHWILFSFPHYSCLRKMLSLKSILFLNEERKESNKNDLILNIQTWKSSSIQQEIGSLLRRWKIQWQTSETKYYACLVWCVLFSYDCIILLIQIHPVNCSGSIMCTDPDPFPTKINVKTSHDSRNSYSDMNMGEYTYKLWNKYLHNEIKMYSFHWFHMSLERFIWLHDDMEMRSLK